MFPVGNYSRCVISDFKCLHRFDSKFSYEQPPSNQYFPDDEEGIVCQCLPECEHIDYETEISPIQTP